MIRPANEHPAQTPPSVQTPSPTRHEKRAIRKRRRLGALGVAVTLSLVGTLWSCPSTVSAASAATSGGEKALRPDGFGTRKPGDAPVVRPAGKPAFSDAYLGAIDNDVQQRVVWPDAATVAVMGGPAAKTPGATSGGRAGSVAVRRSDAGPITLVATPGSTASVEAQLLGQPATRKAGVKGLALRVTSTPVQSDTRPSETTSPSVAAKLRISYVDIANAYGANWEERLRPVAYPACFLTTPARSACNTPLELSFERNKAARSFTIEVPAQTPSPAVATWDRLDRPVPARRTAAKPAKSTGRGGTQMVVAMRAGETSSEGSFAASPLAPSAQWSAGGSTGGFTWSIPMALPPVVDGPGPKVSLVYNSATADGRTAASNNQGSAVGEGFDIGSSFIERRYNSCDDDGRTGKYDLCWATDNAFLTLDGSATELIKVSSSNDVWRLKADDGTRVRRLFSGSTTNPDNDREYWELTQADGTRLYFGRSIIPGSTAETNSVWTVPVVGDDAGEPCRADPASYANSFCQQAWRWNLDYVVDTRDRAMSLWYTEEPNYYTRNGQSAFSADSRYIRGGYINRVDYGFAVNSGTAAARPAAQVVYTTADRCFATSANCSASNSQYWHDTPIDKMCAYNAACEGNPAPTFFTRKRITAVTTQVADSTSTYATVDRWNFAQNFVKGTTGGRSLWLESLTQTGMRSGDGVLGNQVTLPPITFEPTLLLPNRRNTSGDGLSAFYKPRLKRVTSTTGSQIDVNYSSPECSGAANPATNSERCYPIEWTPPGEIDPVEDWMYKFVVNSVVARDPVAGGPAMTTSYDYVGNPAWAYTQDPLTPADERTWSEFRGYAEVITTEGSGSSASGTRPKTRTKYFRGMHGDRSDNSGGTRSVQVGASDGTSVDDLPRWTGSVRETTTYASADSETVMSSEINTPWSSAATAGTTGSLRAAYMTGVSKTVTRERADSAANNYRTREVTTDYDPNTGQPKSVSDTGDTARSGDEHCDAFTYADATTETGTWRIGFQNRTVTSAVECGSNPLAPTYGLISDTRTYYDGATSTATIPTRGLVTKTERTPAGGSTPQLVSETTYTGAPHWLPDTVSTPTAAGVRVDKSTYTLANGLVTALSQVQDQGGIALTTSRTVDPARGAILTETNANGGVTVAKYDAMGRLLRVWEPRAGVTAGSGPASVKYSYSLSQGAPSKITTDVITSDGYSTTDGKYTRSAVFYDSLGREKQTQTDSPVSQTSRVVTSNVYNDLGQVTDQLSDYENTGTAGDDMLQIAVSSAPTQHRYTFDGLGRTESITLRSYNDGLWATNYAYQGMDTTIATPPEGGSATRVVTDIHGRVVASTDLGATGSADDLTTTSTYNSRGYLDTRTGPAGKWTYDYFPDGKVKSQTDPDAGLTTYIYEDTDELKSSTNANGRTLQTTYDKLGRTTRLIEKASSNGPSSDTVLTEWTYDNPSNNGKGLPYETIRYLAGKNDTVLTNGANTDAIVERISGYTIT